MYGRQDFLMWSTRPRVPEDQPGVLVVPKGAPEEFEAFVRQVHDTLQQHGIVVRRINQDQSGIWTFEILAPGPKLTGRIIGEAGWVLESMPQILDTYQCNDPDLMGEIRRYIAGEEGLN